MNCLLCQTSTTLFSSETFLCTHCQLIFKNPAIHNSTEEDVVRYTTHNNDENDQGYINFLKRFSIPLSQFLPASFTALDFGCGPGPTLSILLSELGGTAKNYDPIFKPDQLLLESQYDVVTSTEVVEHFKNPDEDWSLLVSVVKPGGLLGIMTLFYNSTIDYNTWWYKNDRTHIVFYQESTFSYLAKRFNLEILFNDNKSIIIFRKK